MSTSEGQNFASWFEQTSVQAWPDFVPAIPLSRVYEIADEARLRAAGWLQFASSVEGRAQRNASTGLCG
jgi:hypothetical protein